MSFKVRGSAWHQARAAAHGKRARSLLLAYVNEGYAVKLRRPDAVDAIVAEAVTAVHHARIAFEMVERATAPLRQQIANAEANRARQASTPRCNFRRIVDVKLPDGSTAPAAADPCGGKLKVKTRHRVLLGGECTTCGRFYPVPQDPEPDAEVAEPAVAVDDAEAALA